MNVLSLFDGISCGQVALERAGIHIEKYFASEIEKSAIKVTQRNYSNAVQLGDIVNWREWSVDWQSIDLLIGGSPCQGFSFAGKQLAFDDPRSKLFFIYVDILNHIKSVNPHVKFLLENVRMKKQYLDIISSQLGVEPVFIDSADFSAQTRKRYYWCNWKIGGWEPTDQRLSDVLERGWISDRDKSYCLDANYGKGGNIKRYLFRSSRQIVFKSLPPLNLTVENANVWGRENKQLWRMLTPEECEKLQTLPVGYTDVNITKPHRYHALGNGWTVDVIAHIFKGLK